MKVFVIVEHYDRGSDEVNVVGVYSTLYLARHILDSDFSDYKILEEDDIAGEVLETWFYADGEEDASRVMIVEREVL